MPDLQGRSEMNYKRLHRRRRKGLGGYWLPKQFRGKNDRKMNSKQYIQKNYTRLA